MRTRFIYKRNNCTRQENKFKFILLTLFKNFSDSFSARQKWRFNLIKIKTSFFRGRKLLILKYSIFMERFVGLMTFLGL